MAKHSPPQLPLDHDAAYDAGHDAGHHADHGHEVDLAQLLALDAEISGSVLEDLTAWAGQLVVAGPHRIVDLGAGTGAGGLALARRFPAAEVLAVDRSTVMLERVRAAAHGQGLDGRVHAVHADLDVAWPAVASEVDLVWASSFLHEVTDPGAVLGNIRAALRPGGLLVVVEMDALPRFLPGGTGPGLAGLESRCHEALARAGWNAHPDWRPHLERAGFEVVGPRTVSTEAPPAQPATGRFAHAWFSRMRTALRGRLAPEDLAVLDCLLAQDHPEALLNRGDLSIRGSRTAWAAQRP